MARQATGSEGKREKRRMSWGKEGKKDQDTQGVCVYVSCILYYFKASTTCLLHRDLTPFYLVCLCPLLSHLGFLRCQRGAETLGFLLGHPNPAVSLSGSSIVYGGRVAGIESIEREGKEGLGSWSYGGDVRGSRVLVRHDGALADLQVVLDLDGRLRELRRLAIFLDFIRRWQMGGKLTLSTFSPSLAAFPTVSIMNNVIWCPLGVDTDSMESKELLEVRAGVGAKDSSS